MLFARFVAVVAAALFTTSTASAAAIAVPVAATASDGDATQGPSMSVNPGVLTQGGTATISYSNPAMGGQTVVIDIDNGMLRNTQTATVEIQLDAKGCGSAAWTVPAWIMAKFNAPGVAEVALAVGSS